MNQLPDDLPNDPLDDIFAAPSGEVRSEPVKAPADYIPGQGGKPNKFKDVKQYTETCGKCRGTGRYNAPSTHGSRCFECDGVGTKTFRTSPEQRAKAKASTHARKARVAQETLSAKQEAATAFRAANKIVCDWIDAKAATFGFAASMSAAITQWGGLTSGQIEAVRRCIAKDAERKVEAAQRAEAAPAADTAGVDRLKLAFDTAIANAAAKGRGFKMPRITIGGVVISPAKASSANPGALYVKSAGEYLGKIKDGRFFAARECTEDQEKRVLAFVADPKAAAIAYGIETGVCCVCNAELTNKKSVEAGIGPICATKFGW